MFDEWRHIRTLKKRIASLKEQEAALRVNSTRIFADPELAKLSIRISSAQIALNDFETSRLMRKAYKWGVEIPNKDNWWIEDDGYTTASYLSAIGKAGVSRLIQEERRKSIEWWVTVIIVPVLSSLIGILGLIVALIAVYAK